MTTPTLTPARAPADRLPPEELGVPVVVTVTVAGSVFGGEVMDAVDVGWKSVL
jgi:hypothetical protein